MTTTTGGTTGTGGAIVVGTGGAVFATGGAGIDGSATGGAATLGTGGATGTGGTTTGGGAGRGAVDTATGGAGGSALSGGACKGVFCDDFEAAEALGPGWTTNNTLGATIKVVSTYATTPGPTMAHSGKNSVQISFPAGAGYAMLVEKMGFPAPMG